MAFTLPLFCFSLLYHTVPGFSRTACVCAAVWAYGAPLIAKTLAAAVYSAARVEIIPAEDKKMIPLPHGFCRFTFPAAVVY